MKGTKVGIAILTSLGLIAGIGNMKTINTNDSDELNMMIADIPVNTTSISKNMIDDLNVIINDCDCSDSLFDDVCDKLREDNIIFKQSRNNSDINYDGSVVITLDQQYVSGADTFIFAPYDNARIGDSDSLALSMQTALKQNGFLSDDILCGVIGYRENENGVITGVIPTKTEEAIDSSKDTSFVTISFGTDNVNAEWVAKSIENGLARFVDYRNNYDSQQDLIYRADVGQSAEDVANYFGTSTADLCSFNKLESTQLNAQTIINPVAGNTEPFNKVTIYNVGDIKTRAY
jgi:hypothetical protein